MADEIEINQKYDAPWEVLAECYKETEGADDTIIGEPCGQTIVAGIRRREVAELIAAAPELLFAAELAVELIRSTRRTRKSLAVLRQLRSAVAKAKGKEADND